MGVGIPALVNPYGSGVRHTICERYSASRRRRAALLESQTGECLEAVDYHQEGLADLGIKV